MPARRILYLSAHQMTAYRWQAGAVHAEQSFDVSPQGIAEFASYLDPRKDSLFTLLANLPEEGFQIETIPFLQSADRNAVITRKLAQLFYGTPYASSLSLGHEKTRRKDERLLLAALTAQDTITPWVETLRDARAALVAIHSVPFLGAPLLKKLNISDERCILLTVQDQSLRETYFEKGQLHFSRLSPLSHTSIGAIAQSLASEALKLQQYLLSQRMIARNQPLRAIVLAHPQALKAVESSCISTETLSFDIRSTDDCARSVGLKTPPADAHCDPLHVHLAAASPPGIQFAREPARHDYRIWQIRNALFGLGAIVLAGCLLFAGKQFYSAHSHSAATEATLAKANDARQRYDDIVKTFPPIPTNNDTLRQIIDRYAELERGGATPEPLYRDISTALARVPAVEIESIDWKSAGVSPQGQSGTGTPSATAGLQSATVRGTITLGPRATPRQLLAAFQEFVNALAANPALTVTVTQQPFDVESGKALRGGSATGPETGVRPFAVIVARKGTP